MEVFLPARGSVADGIGLLSGFVELSGRVTELESGGNDGGVWWAGAVPDRV